MEIIERLDNNDSLKSIQYIEVIASQEERNIANLIEQEFNSVVDLIVVKEHSSKIVNSAIKVWLDNNQSISIPKPKHSDLKNDKPSKLIEGLDIDIIINREVSKADEYIKNWISQNIGFPESQRDVKIQKEVIKKFMQEAKKLIEQLVRNKISIMAAEQLNYTLKQIRSEQLKNMSKKDKKKWRNTKI